MSFAPQRPPDSVRGWLVPSLLLSSFTAAWLLFLTFGPVGAVDGHFTSRPQDHPEFTRTPWQPDPPGSGRFRREAVLPITFFTLRYTQVTDGSEDSIETVRYDADVRWPRVSAAIVLSGLAVAGVWLVGRRLVRAHAG